MGAGTSKTSAKGDDEAPKRTAILDAALELFAARGFHGTPVPLVAERAKVGAGTVYRYFESKEALVNALFQREKRALMGALLEGFAPNVSPRDGFARMVVKLHAFALQNPRSIEFLELHHHGDYLDDESRALEERLVAPLESYLAWAQREKALKPLAPRMLMALVWGAMMGLLRATWLGHVSPTPADIAAFEVALWEAIRR